MTIQTFRTDLRTIVRDSGVLSQGSEQHLMIEVSLMTEPSVNSLAERLCLDKSTTSRLVSALEGRGLLSIHEDSGDRRRRIVRLTSEGQRYLEEINGAADQLVGGALSLLPADNVATVVEGMALYARALRKFRLREGLIVREITVDDNVSVAKIIRTSLTAFGYNREGFAFADAELDQMYQAYQGKGARYYVAELKGHVIGGAGIAPLEGGSTEVAELRKMYLSDATRGLGIGNDLMEKCLCFAREQGYQTVYLETTEEMTAAHRLYEKHGFVRVLHRMGYTGHNACGIYYTKQL